jgi:hypothetical protein
MVLSGARNSEMSAVMSAYTFFRSPVLKNGPSGSERRRTETMVFTPPSCQSPS